MESEGPDRRSSLGELTDELVRGEIDRRSFLRRGVLLAVSLPTLGAIIAACSNAASSAALASSAPAASATAPGTSPSASAAAGAPLIGFLLRDKLQVRWDFDVAGFKKRADELGVKYITAFTTEGNDQSFQNAKAETFLAQGIKSLVVVPFDPAALQPIVDATHAAGAKFICYEFSLESADFILDRNNESVGAIFANAAVAFAPKGNYALVFGDQGNVVGDAKVKGVMSVLQPLIDKGDIKVVSKQNNKGWDPQLAQAQVEAALALTGGDLNAVVAANDGMGLGAYTALKAAGKEQSCFVTGEDGDLARVQLIAAGLPGVTTWEPFPVQGATAVNVAVALATGKDPGATTQRTFPDGKSVPAIEYKTVALTKDNILAQLVTTGFYSYDDVYKLTPASLRPPSPSPSPSS